MGDITSHRARFRELHESGCFVIPNPWDPGTVRVPSPFDQLAYCGLVVAAFVPAVACFGRGGKDSC
jgi:2-methylisocitrate lyase-like PEP mutase family enzyme